MNCPRCSKEMVEKDGKAVCVPCNMSVRLSAESKPVEKAPEAQDKQEDTAVDAGGFSEENVASDDEEKGVGDENDPE